MLSSKLLSKTSRPAAQRLRQTTGRRMASGVPTEDQAAHTVTGRVKKWALSLPVEVYPLFAVMSFGLGYGIISIIRPIREDGTLRLRRQGFGGHNEPMHWREPLDSE